MIKYKLYLIIATQAITFSITYAMDRDPGDARVDGLRDNHEQELVYQPQNLRFNLVSPANCQILPDGQLSSCVFPRIDVREIYPNLPPLPFETSIRVHAHESCQ